MLIIFSGRVIAGLLLSESQVQELIRNSTVMIEVMKADAVVQTGAGVFISAKMILTNRHVLEDLFKDPNHQIRITNVLGDKIDSIFEHSGCQQKNKIDLCLIKISSNEKFKNKVWLKFSEEKIGLGFPISLMGHCKENFSLKTGSVLRFFKDFREVFGINKKSVGQVEQLLISQEICPGDSGGPIVSISTGGQIVGLATEVFVDQKSKKSYSLGISAREIQKFIVEQQNFLIIGQENVSQTSKEPPKNEIKAPVDVSVEVPEDEDQVFLNF
jgi:hypothetical protein